MNEIKKLEEKLAKVRANSAQYQQERNEQAELVKARDAELEKLHAEITRLTDENKSYVDERSEYRRERAKTEGELVKRAEDAEARLRDAVTAEEANELRKLAYADEDCTVTHVSLLDKANKQLDDAERQLKFALRQIDGLVWQVRDISGLIVLETPCDGAGISYDVIEIGSEKWKNMHVKVQTTGLMGMVKVKYWYNEKTDTYYHLTTYQKVKLNDEQRKNVKVLESNDWHSDD